MLHDTYPPSIHATTIRTCGSSSTLLSARPLDIMLHVSATSGKDDEALLLPVLT